MDLLADNDAMVKLAQCRLLPELLRCFGDGARFLVTETFHPWLRSRLKRQRVPDYVEAEISAVSPTTLDLTPDGMEILNHFILPGIEAGEAVLFAASCINRPSILFTGDKRALRALGTHESLQRFHSALAGKILCVEQSLLLLIGSVGFVETRTKVVTALESFPELDIAMLSCFGSGFDAEPHNVRDCFQSYVDDLKRSASSLLFDPNA